MNKLTRRILILIVVVICVLGTSTTAFATAVTKNKKKNKKVDDCRLTFTLTDKTNGIFIDEITITLFNQDTNLEYNYNMTSADYLFGINVGGNVKQGSIYNIALNYASKGQFIIKNADGTDITNFLADSDAHSFDWVVTSADTNATSTQTNLNSDEQTSKASEYVADTDNADADAAFNTFMESASKMENNSKFDMLFSFYTSTEDECAKRYAEYCGKTEEEYKAFTPFEQFLWYELYVVPVMHTTFNDYDTYFENIDKWHSYVTSTTYGLLSRCGQEQADAYQTLMDWQYNYFIETGTMYNFITGKSSIEENKELEVLETVTETTNSNLIDNNTTDGDPTEKEIQSLIDEENKDKDTGIWSEFIKKVKENAITITILLVLVGTLIGVIIYRKRKAIDGDKE